MSDSVIHLPVAEAYDRWSGFYDAYDNPLVFVTGHALSTLAESVAGKDVFEFGCGTGRNLSALKACGAAHVAGCDLSEGMLAKARLRDPAFEVMRHDMTAPLSRPDRSADLALFCLSLEHVGDLAGPLRQARRVLRPGGAIAILEIHPFLAETGVAAHFGDAGQEVRMPTFPHSFAEYINTAAALSLTITECREWRPRDLDAPLPRKVLKRGRDTPLIVQFSLHSYDER
ncbi:methyltransferase domain-containing protein [Telmatospirillum sp.]|uniref:class I SAM-dependent methyltransferase n=1 Tax=Telmatospirillum sp. TaxID=2079197 RepID=UPI002846E5E0|nr:methyltransferase domain-containing protein [Telmatospirillum sp.]MDR3435740.1 methyltransferase domain-containing protein [Telmatospirillum sp.]